MTSTPVWSRPLVPLTTALAAGIAAPSLGGAIPPLWLFFLIPGFLLLLAVLIWRRWPLGWAACLLFFLLGQGLYQHAVNPRLSADHVRFLPQQTAISLLGQLQNQPTFKGSSPAVDLAALAWSDGRTWRPAAGLVRLYGIPATVALQPGETIVVRLRLRPVAAGNTPDSWSRRLALARQQIFVTGQLLPHLPPVKLITEPTTSGPPAWRQALRQSWYHFLASQPQPARAIFLALLLGDQSELTPELRESFQRTGTSHLLAISGLHLSMIAAAAYVLIFWLLRRWTWFLLHGNAPKVALLLAACPMLTYAWLAGGSPATQRATLMILAGLLLLLLDRPKDPVSLLALAALIILVISPLQLYALSFQLSFLSVWGLLVLAPPMLQSWRRWLSLAEDRPHRLRQLVAWLGQGLTTTAAATLATLPVIMAAFQQVPTYGILINLLAVPIFGVVILPLAFLAVVLSWLWTPPALALATLSRWTLEIGLALITWAASLPGVAVRVPAPTLSQTLAYLAILAGLFVASTRRWRWLGLVGGILVLSGSVVWSNLAGWTQDHFQVTAVAGSRELSLVARFPGGPVLVINAGKPRPLAQPAPLERPLLHFLQAGQHLRLDYLAALTITSQNAATLLALVREFKVQEFWYGGERPPLPAFWELRNHLGDNRKVVKNLSLHPIQQTIGGVRVESRQLPESLMGRAGGPVMLQFEYGGRRLLVLPPGPEAWRERCLGAGLPKSEVLILPAANLHQDFLAGCLRQVGPQALVITGAPPPNALAALAAAWPGTFYQTAHGEVTITLAPDTLKVSQ